MKEYFGVAALLAIAFLAGWGWGQWWGERAVHAAHEARDEDRLWVSMPMKPEDAAAMMGLLKHFVEQVEKERARQDSQREELPGAPKNSRGATT